MIINMDLTGVEAKATFDPLPPGDYQATIENSEVKTGSKGEYISWTFSIDDKPNKVWDIMSLAHVLLAVLRCAEGQKPPLPNLKKTTTSSVASSTHGDSRVIGTNPTAICSVYEECRELV